MSMSRIPPSLTLNRRIHKRSAAVRMNGEKQYYGELYGEPHLDVAANKLNLQIPATPSTIPLSQMERTERSMALPNMASMHLSQSRISAHLHLSSTCDR